MATLVEHIGLIRGLVSRRELSKIGPQFDLLTELTQALERDFLALQAQLEDDTLQTQNDILRSELKAMEDTLERQTMEIKRLQAEIGQREWYNAHHDQKMQDVMVFIAECDDGYSTQAAIGFHFDLGTQLTKHYITELTKRGWVEGIDTVTMDNVRQREWQLTDAGRAELASRGLLS